MKLLVRDAGNHKRDVCRGDKYKVAEKSYSAIQRP